MRSPLAYPMNISGSSRLFEPVALAVMPSARCGDRDVGAQRRYVVFHVQHNASARGESCGPRG